MEVNYTTPTDPARLDPKALSTQLSQTVHAAHTWLSALTAEDAATPLAEDKWAPKQIIGHLTDSAVNNLARIVRAQIGPERLSGYEADAWVDLQHYVERDWKQVLGLWFALNEHITWAIGHIPQHDLNNHVSVAGTVVSLGFIIEDYIAHMRHHFSTLEPWAVGRAK
jgi:hypothetical protein